MFPHFSLDLVTSHISLSFQFSYAFVSTALLPFIDCDFKQILNQLIQMPASLFHIDSADPAASPGCLEDQRALQLALELSMLGLSSESDPITGPFDPDSRGKKSQNTTECVPVPSSEHVAEIVGRQGKFTQSRFLLVETVAMPVLAILHEISFGHLSHLCHFRF